jgi:hypothetical integral membrane protein (TIGR02206 family)
MGGFFDPSPRAAELFPMYGRGHLAILVVVALCVGVLAWQKERLVKLRASRRFMVGLSVVVLIGEVQEYTLMIVHRYEPAYELLPFHLCGMLAFLLPILTLMERYDVVRYLAPWSLAAGLISFLNLGITHNDLGQLTFYHYVWKHLYLFLFPIFLFQAGDWQVHYREYAKSIAGLLGLSVVIFFANWAFGTNYLYIGPENEMAVGFLPDALLAWPLIYPSFIVVGLILFHINYAVLALSQGLRERRSAVRSA